MAYYYLHFRENSYLPLMMSGVPLKLGNSEFFFYINIDIGNSIFVKKKENKKEENLL